MPISVEQFPTAVGRDATSVMDVSRDQITVLNTTGGFIWERLQKGHSFEDVVQALAVETNMSPDAVAPGVERFLSELRAQHLLRP